MNQTHRSRSSRLPRRLALRAFASCSLLGMLPTYALPAQAIQPAAHLLQVSNHAGSPIVSLVAAAPPASPGWTTNLLSAGQVAAGASHAIALPGAPEECLYNLKVTFANGHSLVSSQFNVCTHPTWAVVDTAPMLATLPVHPLPPAVALHPGAGAVAAPQPAPPAALPSQHDHAAVLPPPPPPPAPAPIPAPAPLPAPAPIPLPAPAAPAPIPIPAPAPAPSGHAAPSAQDDADAEAEAFAHSPEGHALYEIPHEMNIGTPYMATATLYAPTATGVSADAHATKVSTYMAVTLAAPSNPGAFTIEPQGNACQFLPEGGTVQWNFKVTPVDVDASRALSLRAVNTVVFTSFIVYGSDANACAPTNVVRRELPADTETVTVTAITPTSLWDRSLSFLANNPGKVVLALLGGGAGIPGLVTMIKWLAARLRRRRQPDSTREASPKPSGAQP